MVDPNGATAASAPPVLFIHVMKTGGTTLLQHLRKNLGAEELYPNSEVDIVVESSRKFTLRHLTLDYLRRLPEERRQKIRVYAGHFPYLVTEAFDPPATTLTLLREPVARTISLLRQWSRNRPELSLSLEEVYELPGVFDRLLHNHQTKVFSLTAEDEPRGYMKPIDVDASRLELAKANLATVDVVGLTERYDDFLDLLVDRFGWHVQRDVRANVSPTDTELPASDALRRRIAEDNAIDVELYEYAVRLVEARAAERLTRP
jgi:hypothetical protein